ncbi:MAG TPA: NADH-ubiquinone oxidoreductase, partial [Thiomonas arsenitoxydans]|nr:NADH-ubiquinone oxidoreductase [Thiomonas arsenitoxydans]
MNLPDSVSLTAFGLAALAWLLALLADLLIGTALPRLLLAAGCALAALGALWGLPEGGASQTLLLLGNSPVVFQPDAAALWLMLPALLPAFFASLLGGTVHTRGWAAGAALSLLGALGVYGLQDGASFLIA